MEAFYIKADSRNLPKLDLEDIFEYAISNADILKTKFRHCKIARLLYSEHNVEHYFKFTILNYLYIIGL